MRVPGKLAVLGLFTLSGFGAAVFVGQYAISTSLPGSSPPEVSSGPPEWNVLPPPPARPNSEAQAVSADARLSEPQSSPWAELPASDVPVEPVPEMDAVAHAAYAEVAAPFTTDGSIYADAEQPTTYDSIDHDDSSYRETNGYAQSSDMTDSDTSYMDPDDGPTTGDYPRAPEHQQATDHNQLRHSLNTYHSMSYGTPGDLEPMCGAEDPLADDVTDMTYVVRNPGTLEAVATLRVTGAMESTIPAEELATQVATDEFSSDGWTDTYVQQVGYEAARALTEHTEPATNDHHEPATDPSTWHNNPGGQRAERPDATPALPSASDTSPTVASSAPSHAAADIA
ncbi:MAG: hypothetical protein KDA60_16545, partial [Planctomycetales bacterium]|nr:hypothetical protein [Planctomycetales bacterium]